MRLANPPARFNSQSSTPLKPLTGRGTRRQPGSTPTNHFPHVPAWARCRTRSSNVRQARGDQRVHEETYGQHASESTIPARSVKSAEHGRPKVLGGHVLLRLHQTGADRYAPAAHRKPSAAWSADLTRAGAAGTVIGAHKGRPRVRAKGQAHRHTSSGSTAPTPPCCLLANHRPSMEVV